MSKKRVPDEIKRVVIGARVTPRQKDTLLAVGGGNISGGLDKILVAMERTWEAALSRPSSLQPWANWQIADKDRRMVINARVTPHQRTILLSVGGGNISCGLDRVMLAMDTLWNSAPLPPAAATPSTPPPSAA